MYKGNFSEHVITCSSPGYPKCVDELLAMDSSHVSLDNSKSGAWFSTSPEDHHL